MISIDMSQEKNVFILLDDSNIAEYNSDALENYLIALSEDVIYIRSEDNKGIFITEGEDAFLIQEHF